MHKKQPLSKVLSASLLTAILLAAAPLNQPTAHAAAASSAAVLAQGMSGSNVSGLQSDLKTLGYFTYPK
ncbi:hypothetical protein O9H85_13615 [Paenibacillus filicis]|uniref:Uncharacterized protein n=1 Tax=Paenibacillus gyeongsangnamensis TaxID=3388067 RepID=A0ABT4Q9E8_9BACL|nr:hypothetical protein [Paenibacillus filicis]MCZ8513449.1 hypothetical protein [Paenibacillus filicis]